ncbi:MAG: hypothetical protein ABR529_07135 [Actinomycetota bacterium]
MLAAVAALVMLGDSSDASGPGTAVVVLAVVGFMIGMFGLRRRITDHGLRALLIASAVGIAASIVGTAFRVSGVALGLPVAVAAIVALARSRWRLGDAGIFTTLLGLGSGAGYVLDARLHPNTGSYGDQGAVALVALGICLSSAAMALLRHLPRSARLSLAGACALTALSFIGLLGAMEGAAPVVVGLSAALLGSAGWVSAGIDLMRVE